MKHKVQPKSSPSIAVRILPVVLLPLLVAALQPHGGFAGLPIVFVAAAFGVVISAAITNVRISLFAVFLFTVLLLCTAHVQTLRDDDSSGGLGLEAQAPARPAFDVPAGLPDIRQRPAEVLAALRWRAQPNAPVAGTDLRTMSVVLPCAFEGEFAEKTVRAIWKNTIHSRLKEILVVDDGSRPPLSTIFSAELLAGGPDVPPTRIIRHEKTMGLIGAKKSGGDAAVGDVIVFLDCHISPRKGWEEAVFKQMKRAGDHRTVVVPTITSLDPDTWEEILNGANGKSCYVLWNSDFTWLANPGRDVPLMSGGLLAMSRKWWQETEGYDEHMVAWGGENIDQSLRIWLCGGRIEVADGAYIAHMWRDPKNPKTTLRYPIPTKDVMRNKARATKAWFGPFTEKVFTFPEYRSFVDGEPLGDMSNFDSLRNKLQCKPFGHYLQRFSYVYLDTGLIPSQIYQIREKRTGLCLQRRPKDAQPHDVVLASCGGGDKGGPIPELQLWHEGNRDTSRPGHPCCGGIMNWNFLQCLDGASLGSKLKTFDCEIQGSSPNQRFALEHKDSPGQFFFRPHKDGTNAQGCMATVINKIGDVRFHQAASCSTSVVPVGSDKLQLANGEEVPAKFRLKTQLPDAPNGACALPVGGEADSGFVLEFQTCDDDDDGQVFRASKMLGGVSVHAGETDLCLDTAGGSKVLVYPCYEEKVGNMNQVWHIRGGQLSWSNGRSDFCIDGIAVAKPQQQSSQALSLDICVPKVGQRLRKDSISADGTFLLKDADGGGCLGRGENDRALAMVGCDESQRWRIKENQVQHVQTNNCIDAGGARTRPMLYPCHRHASISQKFSLIEEPGWVQLASNWGDNGRKRWFEKCIDYKPEAPVDVTIQRCEPTRKRGTSWERLHAHEPLERKLWNEAEKPPPGALPLGGEAAPP